MIAANTNKLQQLQHLCLTTVPWLHQSFPGPDSAVGTNFHALYTFLQRQQAHNAQTILQTTRQRGACISRLGTKHIRPLAA